MKHDYSMIAIVGGGASGMAAAITAAQVSGRHVILFERQQRVEHIPIVLFKRVSRFVVGDVGFFAQLFHHFQPGQTITSRAMFIRFVRNYTTNKRFNSTVFGQ